MSTEIDQKVVEMRFDNKHFENNVSTTLSSLEKLKQNLNLSGATKGLENIDTASRKINMAGLSNAVETVGVKFNAMWTIADQTLRNITNSVEATAKRMISALTIDPIKTGFSEYETKIGAIQTIMSNTASKGATMQDVTRVLDELNSYADKTIYNFAEMTKNIGTFTAAGVGLEESASAIQGIANLAAASGSTSQQASTAMYQLSQALASGTVKLMDWNSVVNAGMGGQKFQDALKATAKEHGVAVDDMIEKNGSFRESLKEGWITADILNETLSKFTVSGAKDYAKSMMESGKWTQEQADALIKEAQSMEDAATKVKTFTQLWDTLKESAQSGWTETWELVVGDFEEAKETLSEIADVVGGILGDSANRRNELLGGALSTGWKQLLGEGIEDATGFEDTISIVAKEHGVNLDEMIKKNGSFQDTLKEGWLTGDMLNESIGKYTIKLKKMSAEELKANGYTQETVDKMVKLCEQVNNGSISLEEFAEKMARPSGRELLIESLWNAAKGLMSVLKPIKEAFGEIFPALESEKLYSMIEAFNEFTKKLTLSDKASDNLKRTFKGIFAVFDIFRQAIVAVFKAISPLFGGLDDLGGGILSTTAAWGDWLVKLNEAIKASGFFEKAVSNVHKGISKVQEFLKPLITGLKEFANAVKSAFSDVGDIASERLGTLAVLGNLIKNIFVGLGKILQKVAPYIHAAVTGIGTVIKELLDRIAESVQGASFDTLFDFANGGIIAAIGVFIAKFIKSGGDLLDNAGGFMENIKDILGGVSDALGAFTQSVKADTLKKIATAVAILAASLLVLSLIDSEKLSLALVSVTALFAELMGSMSIFSKINDTKGLVKVSASLIALASALLILSIALKIMSTMSWSEMGVGLISLTVGLGALVTAVNLLPESKVNKAAKAIKKLSTSLVILAIGIKILSTMSWEEMGIGLISMVVGLGALVAAVNLLPKDTAMRAAGMIALATSMVILAAALKIMATMSWDDIARSLVTLAGSLLILAGAMALMKTALPGAAAMLVVAPALVILASALKIMSSMSWEEIAKGLVVLAGSLLIIAGAMALMTGAIPGAAALLIVTAALSVLTPVLMVLGSMSWEQIAKGLITIAGAFAIMGVAGLVLQPLVPAILALSGALALLGVACTAIGVGVLALGAGLTMIAVAFEASGMAIITVTAGLIALIPYVIEQIGVGIIKLCEVIAGGSAAICETVTVIILAIVDAIVAAAPAIVEGALVLIVELLDALVKYTPMIVGALFDFLIAVLDKVAEKLPDLIAAGVDLLMAFFSGVVEALKKIDPKVLINGIMAVGVMTAIVAAMAAVAVMTPAAMVGVLGMTAVVTELALVMAAIGGLAQIPGLEWLISEGGSFMQTVGTAIGKFLGGIAGGFAQGASAALPQIGTDLSAFMKNAKPFIDGAKSIDSETLSGVETIVGIVAALTAVNIVDGLTSWFTGGSSLTKFGEELAAFGPKIKAYADSVAGIDGEAVVASANAAKALSEMAANVPNEGGVVGWFAGENSIANFGEELVVLGESLMKYSKSVAGFNGEAVIASANAAQALVDMTSKIPNEGGMVAWFTGENSISKFGNELVLLGSGLRAYSNSIAGFNAEAVIASANAAQALVDMTSKIPNEGGMVAWFTGENSVSKFTYDLVTLGRGLRAYSDSIAGFNSEAVIASANAAQALAQMTSCIPNEGGMVAWFTGENSISKFGRDLISLGIGLRGFSNAVAGINAESVTVATNAAKSLATMAHYIPNEGGMVAWLTGENSISKFGSDLIALGKGLMGFAKSTEGMNAENVKAAASSAKSLAQMANYIPNEGGIKAWFSGDNSVSTFASHLPTLGKGLKAFSDAVAGINPTNITAASNSAKSLAKMTETTPKNSTNLITFGSNLTIFGNHLKSYFSKISGVSAESITKSANALKAVKNATNGFEPGKFSQAGKAIDLFVQAIQKMSRVRASAADGFSAAVSKIAKINVESLLTTFKNEGPKMNKAAQELISKFVEGVNSKKPDIEKASESAINAFITGVERQGNKAKTTCINFVRSCATAMQSQSGSFNTAGAYLVKGFANGISSNTYMAKAKARAMAAAAAKAAKDELDEHSPSKVGYEIGDFFGIAFANAIADNIKGAYSAGRDLAASAKSGLSKAIDKVNDVLMNGVDSQPTIRPVLDLSAVQAGAGAISSIFGSGTSVGVFANVGSINSMMNQRSQNGVNDDVVSAINKLNKKLDNVGNTTNIIDGVTYDDGSNVSEAVGALIGALRVERRR